MSIYEQITGEKDNTKKKKKKQTIYEQIINSEPITTSSTPQTNILDEDIAPVQNTPAMTTKDAFSNLISKSIIGQTKDIFSDGFQFSDIFRTKQAIRETINPFAKSLGNVATTIRDSDGAFLKNTKAKEDIKSIWDDGYQFGDVYKSKLAAGKAITGSTTDLVANWAKGELQTAEDVTDFERLVASDILGVAGKLGIDKAARTSDRIRKNAMQNTTGLIFGENDQYNNPKEDGWLKKVDDYSVFGDKIDAIAQSVGQQSFRIGFSQATGMQGAVGEKAFNNFEIFAGSFSRGKIQALQNGADSKTANLRGIVSGLSETISENMFDALPGFKVGEAKSATTVKNILAEGAERAFGKGAGRYIIRGINGVGEGIEERASNFLETAITDVVNAIAPKVASMFGKEYEYNFGMQEGQGLSKDNTFGENVKKLLSDAFGSALSKESDEAFLVAMVSTLITGAATDGMNNNQRNKVINQYARENNISNEKATKLFDGIRDLRLKQITDSTTGYEERMEMQDQETKRLAQELQEGAKSGNKIDLQELFDRTPKTRKESKFVFTQDELKNFDRRLATEIATSNINNEQDVHDMVRKINTAQNINKTVQYHPVTTEGLYQLGFIDKDSKGNYTLNGKKYIPRGLTQFGNEIYVNLDVGTKSATQAMFHEMFESFKATSPKQYNTFKQMVVDIVGQEAIDSEKAQYEEMYKKKGAKLTDNIEDEIINDKFGELAENQDFINRIADNRSVLEKFIDSVKNMINYVKGTPEEKEFIKLQNRLEKEFAKRYKTTDFSKSNVKGTALSLLENKQEYNLGSYQSGLSKTDKSYKYNKVYTYDIKNGGKGDNVQVSVTKTGYVWNNAMLSDSIKGKGEGTKIALDLNQQSIEETGYPLRSLPEYNIVGTKNHTEEGKGLWDSLVRKGFAVKNNDNSYTMLDTAPSEQEYIDSLEKNANTEYNIRQDFTDALERKEWHDYYQKVDKNGLIEKTPGSKSTIIVGNKIVLAEHDSIKPNVYQVYDATNYSKEIFNKYGVSTEDIIQDIYEISEEENIDARKIENYLEKYFEKGLLRRYNSNYNDFISKNEQTSRNIGQNNRNIESRFIRERDLSNVEQNRDVDNTSFSLTEQLENQATKLTEQELANRQTARENILDFIADNDLKNPTIEEMMGAMDDYNMIDTSDYDLEDYREAEKLYRSVAQEISENIKNHKDYDSSDIHTYSTDAYSGQVNMVKEIRNYSDDTIAKLEYADYDNKAWIDMLQVEPEYRRQGLATKLLDDLKAEYGDNIEYGYSTPDGTAFMKAYNNDTRYSLTSNKDSDGDLLTKGQQEYFKDSKAVDSNGNLMVVYHGSRNEYTTYEGGGFFTDDYFNADGYAYGEVVDAVYLNLKNPLVIECEGKLWRELDTPYGTSTREIAGYVENSDEYDGVIFNNVADSWADDVEAGTSTVYYIKDSNQAKRIDNENPTSNIDTRYSLAPTKDNTGKELSKEQQNYFKDTKIVDNEGNLEVVYHTSTEEHEQTNVFNPVGTNGYKFGNQVVNFFTNSKEMSGSYADHEYEMANTSGENNKIAKYQYEGYLNITNPYVIDANGSEWNEIQIASDNNKTNYYNDFTDSDKNKLIKLYEDAQKSIETGWDEVSKLREQQHSLYEKGEYKSQEFKKLAQRERELTNSLVNNYGEDYFKDNLSKLNLDNKNSKKFTSNELYYLAKDNFPKNINDRFGNKTTSTNDIVKDVIKMNKKGANYDGVIIRNVLDYGGEYNPYNSTPSDVYVTFNSNQFKGIDNLNPTENEDIRRSLISNQNIDSKEVAPVNTTTDEMIAPIREDISNLSNQLNNLSNQIQTLQNGAEMTSDNDIAPVNPYRERAIAQREANQRAEEMYKDENYWKSLEEIANQVSEIDEKSVKKMSRNIGKELGLKQKQVKDLQDVIQKAFDKGYSLQDIKNELDMQFGHQTVSERLEDVIDAQRELRNYKIKVSPAIQSDISDYGYWKQKYFGKINFSNNGTPVDVVYAELSSRNPAMYPSDITNPTDQLMRIAEVADMDRKYTIDYEMDRNTIDEAANYISDTIQETLYANAMKAQTDLEENAMQYNERTKEIPIKKKTRQEVREFLQSGMGITQEDLQQGNDIKSFNYQLTTPERVNEKVFGREIGRKINEQTVYFAKHQEAERTRFLNKERAEIKDLGIKARSKESALVQQYGEGLLDDVQLAQAVSDKATQEKIKNAARVLRNKYDTYLDQINEELVDMGYDPIPKRKDYMRHFQELTDKFSQAGIPFNRQDLNSENLPTDINGLTELNVPGKNWFASAQRRTGEKTTYDAITGIDGYLEGASNLMYHTETIQRYRALEKLIRDTYGQTHGLDQFGDDLTSEQAMQRIQDIQDGKLSNYAAWLKEQGNALAGKKASIDRAWERFLGRKGYTVLNTLKKQTGSNMTGFNVRTALTNFISSTIAAAKTNKIAMVKGTIDTIQNIFHDDGFVNKSDFLTTRFGSDSLSQKWWSKLSNAGQIFMRGSDWFTSNVITRSKYYEGIQKGMTETQAMAYANDFAARVMGDRSKGATAEAFNSKTLGLFTQFQLETNNQWQYMIHDTKMEYQENLAKNGGLKAGATMLFQMGQLAAYSYLFNEMFEQLTGSRAAFDIADIFKKLFGLDDDDKDKTFEERMKEAGSELIDALPFASLFGSGGRMPIGEMLTPFQTVYDYISGGTNKYGQDITLKDVKKDTLEALPYYVLPTGYGQIKKTTKGLGMYANEVPGSYTDSGNLRFTADTDTGSIIKNALFGQWAGEEAKKYRESGYKTIRANDIQEMQDLGMKSSEYRKYKDNLKEAGSKNADKLNYINSLDIPINEKNIMASNVVDRDVDMSDYTTYEEFDYAYKNPGKYKTMKAIANNYKNYQTYIAGIDAIRDEYSQANGYSTEQRKKKVFNYVNSLDLEIPQKAMLMRQYYSSYKDYNREIVNYVNNLDYDYEDKVEILKTLKIKVDSNGNVSW